MDRRSLLGRFMKLIRSMEYSRFECLLCKAKTIVSSPFGLWLWSTSRVSPINLPQHNLNSGLKTLVTSQVEEALILPLSRKHPPPAIGAKSDGPTPSPSPPSSRSSSLSSFSSLSRSSSYTSQSSSLPMDDLIGSDSGVYMMNDEDDDLQEDQRLERMIMPTGKRKCRVKRAEYPPPIPSLSRTGTSLPSRMPRVMIRQYDSGKLILREERVNRREYFEAHRVDGRLVLNLVVPADHVS